LEETMPAKGDATDAQKAALNAGRLKANETIRRKAAEKRAAKAAGEVPEKSRHQMLLDGELSVDELDEMECQRFRGRDIDNEFKGRTKPLPPRIYNAIRDRLVREMDQGFKAFLPRAQAILEGIAESGEKDSDRVKATALILERGAGKVPDIVRVGVEDPWDAVLKDALGELSDAEAAKAKERLDRMGQGREAEQDA
jgi:hypothetical protein